MVEKKSSLYRDEIKTNYMIYMEENIFQDFFPYTKINGVSIFVSIPHCYYPSYS